jgi:hypothetical protein
MRERAPLLHHQYIGQYEGPAPVVQVNNSRLSDSILQQHDELQIRSRLAVQQQALEMEEFDEDSDDEEDDEQDSQEDPNEQAADPGILPAPGAIAREGDGEVAVGRRREEGEEVGQRETGAGNRLPPAGEREGLEPGVGGTDGAHAGTEAVNGTVHISAQQQAENREEFLSIMKARFLAGDEEGVNYDAIDKDASLDEHWAKEEQQDAEDKYFDDVD